MANDILLFSIQIRFENLLNCRITDNLPCATKFELLETGEIQYEHGYKLGSSRIKRYVHSVFPSVRFYKYSLFSVNSQRNSWNKQTKNNKCMKYRVALEITLRTWTYTAQTSVHIICAFIILLFVNFSLTSTIIWSLFLNTIQKTSKESCILLIFKLKFLFK